MKNISDYSFYVNLSYSITIFIVTALIIYIIKDYIKVKNNNKSNF